MNVRKTKEMLGHTKLVTRLSKSTVTNVLNENGKIQFRYDGQKHTSKVSIKPHVKWVGTWNKNGLSIDDNVRNPKDMLCMSIHEAVESYVARRYGVDRDYTAHFIATAVEKAYARNIRHNWDDYQMRTELIYREENKWGKK